MSILEWFTGGAQHPYHTLFHCMSGDTFWVTLTVVLDLTVAAGYGIIAYHWWKNARNLPASPARRALNTMRNIFIFCCICGYLFIPIKMFWPAWRLYDVFLAALAFYTWRYAISSKHLKVIYNELGRSSELSAALARSQEESRRKSGFLNALSHDMRTPLNGIMLNIEVARASAEDHDDPALLESLSDMEASARAAAGLLETLLECARLDWLEEPNTVSTFSLLEVVRQSLRAVQGEATRKNLYLQATGSEHVYVRTDRQKLARILANLIGNAVKFTDEGGVKVAVERAGEDLELHVIDSGIGLAPEQCERLFEEFYQVDNHARNRAKGFGLGLAIARRLARQLGGDIAVDSSAGSGSRFSLQLPGVRVRRGQDQGHAAEQPVHAITQELSHPDR